REAPSLDNVPLLLEQGADIYAYDPVGSDHFKKKFPEGKIGRGSIRYVKNPQDALNEANVCFIFTEWAQVKSVKPEDYKKLMRTPLLYDGRNIYSVKDMMKAGVEYHSVGRQF
ncbi:MAG: UDP binding domain-containing protein, partial [Candidatus Delongbacteria bacterium]|nr:UDP binding domain-containing protein [Candidatus Delongbacteria bacterium]